MAVSKNKTQSKKIKNVRCGTQTIKGAWVAADQWPNARTLKSCVRDIFRLEKARTGPQKALALWNWILRMYHRGSFDQEGDPGFEGYLLDTLKALNVHGFHYCDGWGRLMANLWQASGGQARKIVCRDMGHTVCELRYKDDDGVTRWHVFDPQNGWYVTTRDGSRVASMEELDQDPSLILEPAKRSIPWFHIRHSWDRCKPREFFSANWTVSTSPQSKHRMDVSLRPGESLVRYWDGRGAPYLPGNGPAGAFDAMYERYPDTGELRDPVNEPYYHNYYVKKRKILDAAGKPVAFEPVPDEAAVGGDIVQGLTYGTVKNVYEVPLADGRFSEGAACTPLNLISEAKPSAESALLHSVKIRHIAQLIYEVRLPYLITDAEVEATIRPGVHRLDVLNFAVSVNGGTAWNNVFGGVFGKDKAGIGGTEPRDIRFSFGAKERAEGKFSVNGKYSYLLRLDLVACADPRSLGLDRLKIITTGVCNMFSLPMFLPGRNEVSYKADKAGAKEFVRVGYRFDDAKEKNRLVEKILPARGGKFIVVVAGKKPTDVRMREQFLEAL